MSAEPCFYIMLVLFSCPFLALAVPDATISPDNVFLPEKRGDASSFQQLIVDQKSTSVYVGGRGVVYRLWLYNINDTGSANLFAKREWEVHAEDRDECLRNGNSPYDCDAWVRLIFLKSDGYLLMCSSEGMKPLLSSLDGSTLRVVEQPRTVIGICSPHMGMNTTAVLAEFGNPDDLPSIYSGIRTGLSLENHLIYRPPLVFNNKEIHPAMRTVFTDSRWLNEPQFVGSFDIKQYVYFFFRELATESEIAGGDKSVYSRVARICKKDLGGKNVLRQVWSSFVKVRLNCSLPSNAPSQPSFYFDFIQSVVKVEREQGTYFYATFTTPESDFFEASAVCAFSLSAIEKHFDNGLFLEQSSSLSVWTITQPDRIPPNRPGACLSDSRADLSDEDLHFAKSHLLLASSVDGELVYLERGTILTKLVADHHRSGDKTILFVLEPFTRTLFKLLHLKAVDSSQKGTARLLTKYKLADSERVNQMALLPGEYIFTAGDRRVSQYRLGQCSLHERCDLCARDPYCSWNVARNMCFARERAHSTTIGWVFDLEGSEEKCAKYLKTTSRTIYPGDGIHLPCVGLSSNELEHSNLEWRLDQAPVPLSGNDHIVYTREGGLALFNITKAQGGTYQCLANGVPVVEHSIIVDNEDCTRPKSVEQFRSAQRDWCKKLNAYKSNLSRWQSLYEKKAHDCPGVTLVV